MSLVELANQDGRAWSRIGDSYNVTKKPRDLDIRVYATIPFIPMESVPQGGSYEPSFVPKAPNTISSGTYFERGDILVSKITPSFENGKQALIQSLPLPFGYATTEVIPLRPIDRNKHDPRLLFFYLLHPDVRHFVAERMEGSTGRQRVPEGVLLDLLMPDMEYKEQKQAADALELIQSAIAAEERAMQNAQALKQSAMRELFTKGLRGEAQKETSIGLIPASWTPTPIVKLGAVKGGKRMPKGISLVSENTGHPYIRVTDFKSHSVNKDSILYVPTGYENIIRKYRISSSDIYISIAGSIGLVGQVPESLNDANLTENAAKIVIERADVLPRYVMYALASLACQDQFIRATAKNAQPKLALTRIEQTLVPFPANFDEQNEVATVLSTVDQNIHLHRQKRAVLEQLFQSLLHKLMTGEIRVSELDLSALAKGEAA